MRAAAFLIVALGAAVAHATNLPYRYPASGPYYVSTAGNDTTGDGSAGTPWATVDKAASYIRTNGINKAMIADVTVYVAPGTYPCPAAFGAADSGFNGHYVIYAGSGSPGQAVLSAGTTVTGWTVDSGSVMKATVSSTLNFYALYENGVRADAARSPDRVVGTYPMARTPYYTALNNGSSLTALQYDPADFDPTGWTVSELTVGMWSGSTWSWFWDQSPVSSINATTHVVTVSEPFKFYTFRTNRSRYFIQGGRALVTQAGEWYLDRSAHVLYYWPRSTPITSQTIIAPTAQECLQVFGAGATTRASHIKFDGLAVANTDSPSTYHGGYSDDINAAPNDIQHPSPQPHLLDPTYDYFAEQPAYRVGAVHLRDTDTIVLSRMHVSQAGLHGIWVDGAGQQITIRDSLIEYVGGAGIKFNGRYPGEGDVLGNSTLTDLKIHDFGQFADGLSGIEMAQTGGNTISYCEIYQGARKAIWIFANSFLGTSKATSWIYSRGNLVDHVLVHDVCQNSGDTGAISASSLSSTVSPYYVVNTFRQIISHDIHADVTMPDIPPSGLFFDDETSAQVAENVYVYNTQGLAFRFNPNSSNYTLTNTSFQSDGSANPSFNSALMDTANIGVTSSFPY